jgi:hypothetical protein
MPSLTASTVNAMVRAIRRLFWLALLGGAGFAGYTVLQRRTAPAVEGTSAGPVVDRTDVDPRPLRFAETAAPADQTWIEPVDGECPDGYPIKGNASSGIYHVPGGRFYERTIPERCYAHEADAEADGYRPAKA